MHDGVRRALIFLIVLALSAAVLMAWRARDGGRFDLFDLLSGGRAPQTEKEDIRLRQGPALSYSDVEVLARLNEDYKTLTAEVTPAVVSITTGRAVNQPVVRRSIFGTEVYNQQRWEPGLGSGVIVSEDGYVVTNYHVVKHVQKIEVTLAGEDRALPVRRVGHSERLDIAVLKIQGEDGRKFAHLPLGDSDKVETGEIVFAVGNPFGFRGTVTHGIISAKNRRLSDSSAELFQTNTIINPGNSGGPLVNIFGEVIGINTAIYSGRQQTGLWQGVGLAIASNDVRDVLELIGSQGRTLQGYLGVNYLPARDGRGSEVVRIYAVEPDSPAERAGLRAGDVVLEFGGKKVRGFDDFSKRVRRARVDETVPVKILRDGEEQVVDVTIAELDEDKLIADRVERSARDDQAVRERLLAAGVVASDVPGGNGVRIERVASDSPWFGRVMPGDRILAVGSRATPNLRTLGFLLQGAEAGDYASIIVERQFGPDRVGRKWVDVPVPFTG